MASLLKYNNKSTLHMLNRKVALRQFRSSMGDLARQANQEDNLEKKVDLQKFMNNPQEVYSKQNVNELESKLKDVGRIGREYIDDVGLNQTVKDAPTNDIEGIKTANAKAIEFDTMLSPDASLISEAKDLEQLQAIRRKKTRDQRRRMRIIN